MATTGKEEKAAAALTNAVSDVRFNPHKFGRHLSNQPIEVLQLTAPALLSFFEMLSVRLQAGDVQSNEELQLFRVAKRVTQVWAEETLD